MINVSKEFKEKIKYGRFLLYLTITLADGNGVESGRFQHMGRRIQD